jgi:hypothetical protein
MRIIQALKNNWKLINWKLIIIGILLLIIVVGEEPQVKEIEKIVELEKVVEVEKVIEKTPQACKDLVELDNAIFTNLGTYFEKVSVGASTGDVFEFVNVSSSAMEELNRYINTKTATRNELAINCSR